jgi:hypothetical protein
MNTIIKPLRLELVALQREIKVMEELQAENFDLSDDMKMTLSSDKQTLKRFENVYQMCLAELKKSKK